VSGHGLEELERDRGERVIGEEQDGDDARKTERQRDRHPEQHAAEQQ